MENILISRLQMANDTLSNIREGMKSIVFPRLVPKEPIKRYYNTTDSERLNADYQKSLLGIKKEVNEFGKRHDTSK